MAPNKTSGKRDKGKIDQFFPRLAKGAKSNEHHDKESDIESYSDSDKDDDQWNVSLSELVSRKRLRVVAKSEPPTTSPRTRTGGAVPGPTQNRKATKIQNRANCTANSDMIDTSSATNNNNNNNNTSEKGHENSIHPDNKVTNANNDIQSPTSVMDHGDSESNDKPIPPDTNNHNSHATSTSTSTSTSQSTTPTSNLIRPAPVPSLRRCLGHAVGDFTPLEPTSKTNWLDRLAQRSLNGHRLDAKSIPTSCHNWIKAPPSRVALTSPSTSIEHLAWDPLGALLCVAGPRTIFIYDWDMLRVADMASKGDRQRQTNARYQIPPLLEFSVPHAISHLQWNPYNPDQLAVGFKLQGILHLYQLDAVLEWREKHPSSSQYPPRSCFQLLQPPSSTGTVHAVLFLPNSIVATMGPTLYCWNLDYSLQWRYQPPSMGTCLAKLTDTWILLATIRGQFLTIDASKTERTALSLQYKPTIIHEWNPKPSQRVMNCQIIQLFQNNYFQLLWITQDGFVYQTTILISTLTTPSTTSTTTTTKLPLVTYAPKAILYSPPKVSNYTANMEPIPDNNNNNNHYSIPQEATISHHTNNAWIWPQVPKMSRYLGHHDKFVIDRMTIVRDPDRALIWYSRQGKSVSIPATQPPKVVALHPDSEWIVMGVGTQLVLLVNRAINKATSSPVLEQQEPRDSNNDGHSNNCSEPSVAT